MHCYIVIYDLTKPVRNYTGLYSALKSYEKWGKITESTWAIVTDSNAVDIRSYLLSFLDNDDRLMVIKSGQEAAWNNAKASNEWLQNNLAK